MEVDAKSSIHRRCFFVISICSFVVELNAELRVWPFRKAELNNATLTMLSYKSVPSGLRASQQRLHRLLQYRGAAKATGEPIVRIDSPRPGEAANNAEEAAGAAAAKEDEEVEANKITEAVEAQEQQWFMRFVPFRPSRQGGPRIVPQAKQAPAEATNIARNKTAAEDARAAAAMLLVLEETKKMAEAAAAANEAAASAAAAAVTTIDEENGFYIGSTEQATAAANVEAAAAAVTAVRERNVIIDVPTEQVNETLQIEDDASVKSLGDPKLDFLNPYYAGNRSAEDLQFTKYALRLAPVFLAFKVLADLRLNEQNQKVQNLNVQNPSGNLVTVNLVRTRRRLIQGRREEED